MLNERQFQQFTEQGHVTVPHVFDERTIAAALEDVQTWSQEFLHKMTNAQRSWFLEQEDPTGTALRKLEEPVYHRPVFRQMAQTRFLIDVVEQLVGSGVSVIFSQLFCKPPEVGGPKPVHQDNFYFGPDRADALLTVWIALDEATVDNGCLYYGNGSQLGPVIPHVAPPEEPFNLQIPSDRIADYRMTPAPVPAGGISLHHGNAWHQSSSNTSTRPRRPAAFHYLQNDASLTTPALEYNAAFAVRVS